MMESTCSAFQRVEISGPEPSFLTTIVEATWLRLSGLAGLAGLHAGLTRLTGLTELAH